MKNEPRIRTCMGGCHCGRVRFEVAVPDLVSVTQCNCSICKKSGYLHLTVTTNQFRLLSGKDDLTDYRFHTGVASHLFCRVCGIKSFYVPRSHPDGFSVNLNCLELPDDIKVSMGSFDGQNWLKNRAGLH